MRAKETFDKAARKYADAKRKLDKWLNRLTKDQKDKLKKAEEEAKTTYKDSFEAIKAEDRARTGYFMADDTLKEAEDKLKDPNIAEKDKPTEEEMESLRADAKARKESLSNAKKESQRLGEKAKSADDKLKEILAKDFPGKENEYGADKGNLDEAKEQMDKAESGLKDAREKAMKG